jgi:hypothetical protein
LIGTESIVGMPHQRDLFHWGKLWPSHQCKFN